ncbi:MAG: PAS domain S-box protein [bacterium]
MSENGLSYDDLARRCAAAEQALAEMEKKYRVITENSCDMITLHDVNGVYQYASPACKTLLGYEPEELVGRNPYDLFHPDDIPVVQASHVAVLDGKPYTVVFRLRGKDGVYRWLETNNTFIVDDDGKVTGLICVTRDIGGRKQADEKLRTSEERFRAIFENNSAAIAIIEYDTTILMVNDAYCKMGGYSRDEIIGISWTQQIPPDDLGRLIEYNHNRQINPKDSPDEYEFSFYNKKGEIRQAVISLSVIENNKKIIAVFTDITERKQAELALEKRMMALTSPLADTTGINFDDLFNLDEIQQLQDEFARATGVASVITHPDGTPITTPGCFTRFCKDIVRKTEKGCANCYHSDAVIGKPQAEGPIIQRCISGGLWDAGAGISVGGRHIANWLIGQVRDETQTEEEIRAYAREIGVDEDVLVTAFYEVPSMSHEQFQQVAQVLFTLANQLSASAYQNVQQARFISERKRAEAKLRESELKYRQLAQNLPDITIFIYDHELRYTLVEGNILPQVDYSTEQLLGKTFWEVLSPEGAEYLAPYYKAALEGIEQKNVNVGYGGRYYNVDFVSIRDLQGEIVAGMVVSRDITEQEQAAEALRASEERYRSIFNGITEGFALHEIVCDGEGTPCDYRFLEINPSFETLTGLQRANVVGKLQSEVLPDEDPKWVEMYGKVALTGEPCQFDNYSPVLKKHFEVYAYSPAPRQFAVLFMDITARKQAEAERDRLQAQLEQAHKMESIGRLAGGVAHDFNNMLGVIMGYTDLAMLDVDPASKLHANLIEIQKASERSADLTRQLLAFARKQTVSPKVLDLNDTISGMLKMLRRLIGEDIDLSWIPGDDLWTVKIDPSQVDQMLANLCVNARDAICGVGKVTIETTNILCDEVYCAQNVGALPGEYIMLAVSDNGSGIDAETREHLFEPFYTTKGVGAGTGLGLSTVYGAVIQNGGFINVYSEPGRGTSFKIFLPRHHTKIENISAGNESAPIQRGKETVLLVEDEPAILSLGKKVLEHHGYQVITAATPGEAISKAEEYSGEIHLLLTDVIMPEMNGRDLARHLITFYPNIKRLFMSGYTANVIAHHGVLEDGVNFLQKPFTIQDLAVKVREVLDQ